MSSDSQATVHGDCDGVVAGTHPPQDALRVLAGPATDDQFNRVRSAIFPIACFKVENMRFAFDSSVVMPELKQGMPLLAKLISEHTEPDYKKRVPPISIFGHADPVGGDDLNKALSGRRAAAIYGLLTRRTEIWEDLYNSGTSDGKYVRSAAGDVWGTRSIQVMLNGLPPDQLAPAQASGGQTAGQPLDADGKLGPKTQELVRRFQAGPKGQAAGLAVDGDPGPATRKALFLAYMDVVCVDAAGKPFKVDPKDGFLAHNVDPAGKGDFQGCGEFNPVLLFSQEDEKSFAAAKDKSERNAANAENRRVMVLLFRPGLKVTPDLWPCPKANDGVAGCRKRFWSDGEKRRSNQAEERRYDHTKDTFACRFYQRLVSGSPCETVLETVRIRLHDRFARPLPGAPCVVTHSGKDPWPTRASGTAVTPTAKSAKSGQPQQAAGDDDDETQNQDGFVIVRNIQAPATVNVKWNLPEEGDGPGSPPPDVKDDFEFELDVFVDIPDDDPSQASLARLRNMGYIRFLDDSEDIRGFQYHYKPRFDDIVIDGKLNPATIKAIQTVHDECNLVLKDRTVVSEQ